MANQSQMPSAELETLRSQIATEAAQSPDPLRREKAQLTLKQIDERLPAMRRAEEAAKAKSAAALDDDTMPEGDDVSTGEAALHLGTEAMVPFAHRLFMPLGEAIGDSLAQATAPKAGDTRHPLPYTPKPHKDRKAPDEKSFGDVFSEESKAGADLVRRAREQHPGVAFAADAAGMLASPLRGAGAAGVAGKIAAPLGRVAQLGARAVAGATQAGLSTAETVGGAGGSLEESLNEGAAALPAGALGGLVPGNLGPVGSTAAGAVVGAAGERAGRAVRGESITGDPMEMLKAAGVGGFFGLLPAAVSAARKGIRNPLTRRGKNIAAVEAVPKEQIAKYSEGDEGIGESALETADAALPALEAKRVAANKAFGTGEQALLQKSAGVRVSAEPIIKKLDHFIETKSLSDGTPLDEGGVAELQRFRDKLMNKPPAEEAGPAWREFVDEEPASATAKTVMKEPLAKQLTVEDLVKMRRETDAAGHQGKVAGRSDVPHRAISSLLREEMIPLADKDLAQFLTKHSQHLSSLEDAHGALVLREDSALPETTSLRERAQRRVHSYGMGDASAPARNSALDEAAKHEPALATGLKRTRAKRGKEELAFGQTLRLEHGASPRAVAGFVGRNKDPALYRADKALGALQQMPGGSVPLLIAALREARRRASPAEDEGKDED